MKELPILFSAPMINAIREGRKTQTRRVMKPQPEESFAVDYNEDGSVKQRRSYGWSWRKGTGWPHVDIFPGGESLFRQFCPYGAPGDRLWVRETFYPAFKRTPTSNGCVYRADDNGRDLNPGWSPNGQGSGWTPSIHMPRWASRITLTVTTVHVERLQSISEGDALAEGVEGLGQMFDARIAYAALWQAINGAGSWDLNPWVWVVGFELVKR